MEMEEVDGGKGMFLMQWNKIVPRIRGIHPVLGLASRTLHLPLFSSTQHSVRLRDVSLSLQSLCSRLTAFRRMSTLASCHFNIIFLTLLFNIQDSNAGVICIGYAIFQFLLHEPARKPSFNLVVPTPLPASDASHLYTGLQPTAS